MKYKNIKGSKIRTAASVLALLLAFNSNEAVDQPSTPYFSFAPNQPFLPQV
jgi:hypothetical protein